MGKHTVEIDLEELKQEVFDFLASIERDRITPKPVQRIGVIIKRLRLYKMAIVKANVPRRFDPRSQGASRSLREHRDSHLADTDPETSLGALREWLKTLDCAFVLAGELYWRLNDCDWEREVWTPIHKWVETGFTMLYGDMNQDEWPVPVDLTVLEVWEQEVKDLEFRLLPWIAIFLPENDFPVVEENTPFTIRWRCSSCYLGDNDSFRIMRRLIESKGRMVPRENIGLAIDNRDITDEAVRKAASRLRKRLADADFGDLATKIKTTDQGRYVCLDMKS